MSKNWPKISFFVHRIILKKLFTSKMGNFVIFWPNFQQNSKIFEWALWAMSTIFDTPLLPPSPPPDEVHFQR